jgi:hypothetical protein
MKDFLNKTFHRERKISGEKSGKTKEKLKHLKIVRRMIVKLLLIYIEE